MNRWPVLIALLLSLAFCGFFELRARQKYAATQQQIALRQAELQKISDVDAQVQAYQKQKAELQHRIDLLQQIYAAAQKGNH